MPLSEDDILQKSYKILTLAALLFLSALTFFAVSSGWLIHELTGGNAIKETGEAERAAANVRDEQKVLSSISPDPARLEHFTYTPGGESSLEVQGVCRDTYYTILIFLAAADYRTSPQGAKFNSAYPCQGEKTFRIKLSLAPFLLSAGEYYLLRAHQGEQGSWYDPY